MADIKYIDKSGLAAVKSNLGELFATKSHDHNNTYYTESEVNTLLDGKSNTSHDHDDRYYTEAEIDTKLNGKSNTSHDHDNRYIFKSIYHGTGGALVKLNVASDEDAMISVEIKGNAYCNGYEARTINTIVEFYNYQSGNAIIATNATHYGYNFGDIKVFNYEGVICLWFKQSHNYQTFSVFARKTAGTTKNYNVVESIVDTAMPASGVTRLKTITPKIGALIENIPTSVSQLTNDKNYITSSDNASSATKLFDNSAYTLFGQTFFNNGKPVNVGSNIPATASYYNFRNNANTDSFGYIGRGGSADLITFGTYGDHAINFMTNSEPRMSIAGSGGVNVIGKLSLDTSLKLSYGSSALCVETPSGKSYFGAMNTGFCHIYTDLPSFYMDKSLSAQNLTSRGSLYTNQYVWFNSGSAAPYYHSSGISWHNNKDEWASSLMTFGDGYTEFNSGVLGIGKSRFISYPNGGTLNSDNGSETGYIKITLPQSWSSTMLQFYVDIYNYSAGEMSTYIIGGYNYNGGTTYGTNWVNTSAYSLGKGSRSNLPVYFGHDGTKCCIYIGNVSTTWSYPHISVHSVTLGHSNFDYSKWASGWNISFTTTLGTISGSTYENPNIRYGLASTGHNHDDSYSKIGHTHSKNQITDFSHSHDYLPFYQLTSADCNTMSQGLTAVTAVASNQNAANHSAFLTITNIGTPFQLQIPDSSEAYVYKRYKSGSSWSAWSKLSAGYADSAGSASSSTYASRLGDSSAYHTKATIDTALAGKANSSHGNHVPTTQTANNAIFLRNDNTWATVTPSNIGAAASSHSHDIEIGGRNYLQGYESEWGGNYEYQMIAITDFVKNHIGERFTISAEIKTPVAGPVSMYSLGRYNVGFSVSKTLEANKWTKIQGTGTFSDSVNDPNGNTCNLSWYGTYNTGRNVYIRNVKIEKGNYATDYTPAFEQFSRTSHSHTSFANNISVTGSVTASKGFFDTSDARLKDFYDDIDVDFDKLRAIPKKYFSWKSDENKEIHLGTSAQEIQEIYPELVNESETGELSVDYAKLSVVSLAAVDKLYDKISKIEQALIDKGIL